MAAAKTQRTGASVKAFIASIENDTRRKDAQVILDMMCKVTGKKAEMWGPSIVGFGTRELTYASGQTTDWPIIGFSPRKTYLAVYFMDGFKRYDELLAKLGKHKKGKSCLNINKLADVDMATLEQMVERSVDHLSSK